MVKDNNITNQNWSRCGKKCSLEKQNEMMLESELYSHHPFITDKKRVTIGHQGSEVEPCVFSDCGSHVFSLGGVSFRPIDGGHTSTHKVPFTFSLGRNHLHSRETLVSSL